MTSPTVTESHSVSTCCACHSALCVHFNCPECGPCQKCVEMYERIARVSVELWRNPAEPRED